MANVRDNPYEPPTSEQTSAPATSTQEKSLLGLVLGTIVGGLVGNLFGTQIAKLYGAVPGPMFEVIDAIEVRHAVGFVCFILGCFTGGWVGRRIRR